MFPDSAPSLLRLTGKGLMPLSSLSFSCFAFSANTRMLSASGWSVLPPPDSRRQCCVTRTCRALHPIGHDGFGPCPAWGFEAPLHRFSPALSQTALPDFTAEHFPLAHIRELHLASMRL